MIFKWQIFKTLLYLGLILSISTFAGWTIFYIRIHSIFRIGIEVILFFIALFISILHTIFLFWIMKKKFPDGLITNTIQGITYLLSIILFIACLYVMTYGGFFINAIIKNARPPNNFVIFSKYLAIETVILSTLYIYIGANTLLLINTISKKRLDTIRKISEIGRL